MVCPKFLAFDPSGRFLAISKQCAEPGGIPARDSVDILDLTSGRRHRLLQGPPLVGGPVAWIPQTDRILVDGWDACRSSICGHNRPHCPVFPGQVAYVWQTSDGALARTVAIPAPDFFEGPYAFSPDGLLAIMGGAHSARVMDTAFFRLQEGLNLQGLRLNRPLLDPHRRRLYFAVPEAPKIYALDLPTQDCNPPNLGPVLHWPFDGALAERIEHRDFASLKTPEFVPGLVGQAVNLTRVPLELRSRSMLADGITTGDGTFALWLRPQAPGRIAEFLGDGKPLWRLSLSASLEPVFQAEGSPPLSGGSPLAASRWHHLAIARHADRIQLFLDGRPHASATIPAAGLWIHATERTLRLGPLPAVIDEVTVFNQPLSQPALSSLIEQARSCLTGQP